MSKCNCNCDPCKCRKPVYVPCVTSNTTTLPPCEVALDCVRGDLQQTLAGVGTPVIDNICAVARKCVNEGLGNYAEGSSSGLENLTLAIITALKSLPGYSASGTKDLRIVNGMIQWLADGATPISSTTTTINPSQPSTTTLMADVVYFGAKLSASSPTELEIISASSLVTDAGNDVSINFNPFNLNPQYLWFAIPARTLDHNKNRYYFSAINQGNIGGASNLFGSPDTVSISGMPYLVWITNYATQTAEPCLLSKI